ncbi:hypothetical protein N7478_012190 [Penicillium angulare]|uniref:uncharacterized protein n=1 Tax=Penicillium angulare TaxID=116970 RepID=UPI00254220A9|nr:uncharacterized protein N7478_012190 [Penicillium angulare]KAJ5260585.1 hypothetical protein N7478_012190 [Penicillium angulare]
MSSFFSCCSVAPYRPTHLQHEGKFDRFITWAKKSDTSPAANSASFFQDTENLPEFAVQFVQQVNYGPVEAKRYFIPSTQDSSFPAVGEGFLEVTEQNLITGNFQKLNSLHNKFFEINLYQKDPINLHHWKFNIARSAGNIDI